jgi:exopolysaccharide production protein ExoZ
MPPHLYPVPACLDYHDCILCGISACFEAAGRLEPSDFAYADTNLPPPRSLGGLDLDPRDDILPFFLLSYFTRHFVLLVMTWVVAIVLVWACEWSPSSPLLAYFLAPINLEFAAGMAAALVAHKLPRSWWPALLCFGVLGAAVFLLSGLRESARVWFGFALVPLVLSLVILEEQRRIPSIWTMLLLGNASYAIYLVHYPVVAVVARVASPLQSWLLSFLACIVAGVAAGLIYHWLIERPGLRLFSSSAGR